MHITLGTMSVESIQFPDEATGLATQLFSALLHEIADRQIRIPASIDFNSLIIS